MIRFQRLIRTARGRGLEATQWAKDITAYVNAQRPEANLQVFSLRFGDINTIVWQVDFDNLTALDQYQQFLNTNEGYWAWIRKSVDLFMEGSVDDTVLESL